MKPRTEFQLIPFGEVKTERASRGGDFTFTREMAEKVIGWFTALGRHLAIDYNHQSIPDFNLRPDGLAPAAGWIGGFAIRPDGLWATRVEWTPKATELIAAGEYRYFSPVIFWADDQHTQITGLGPVALTNNPAMNCVLPLVASQGSLPWTRLQPRGLYQGSSDPNGEQSMDKIKQLLGLSADASEADVVSAVEKALKKESGGTVPGGGSGGGDGFGGGSVALQSLATKLDLGEVPDENALVLAVRTKIAAAAKPDATILERMAKLESDNAALRKKADEAEFETICSSGAGAGKITPGMKPHFKELFHANRKQFDSILSTLPVIAGGKSELEEGDAVSGGQAGDPDRHPYLQKIDATVLERKCSKMDAMQIVQREQPALYEQYMKRSR